MTQNRLAVQSLKARTTRWFQSAAAVSSVVIAASFILFGSGVSAAAGSIRIAVAPFASADVGAEYGRRAANSIVTQLRKRPLERLIEPGHFVADARPDPSAEEVRIWAYNAAVEAVVIGRIFAKGAGPEASGRAGEYEVEAILLSGHSGAEIARHNTIVADPKDLIAAGERLAAAILVDLEYIEPVSQAQDAWDSGHRVGFETPTASAGQPGSGAVATRKGGGRGLDASLDQAGFDNRAPIEIKADEAEIISREYGRDLIFQRNVRVRQANVTLRSDHLEASYLKGQSEPEKLVARGKVFVDQGDRRAKCDQATYLREAQKLTCTGHAELIQGCDVVRGDTIQFDLDGGGARVEGAASIVIRPNSDDEATTCGSQRGVM